MVQKIVLATDFSESCENALSYIKQMIQGTDVKVELVHVYDIPITTVSYATPQIAKQLLKDKKAQIIEELQTLSNLLPEANQGEVQAIYGVYPSSDIAYYASSIEADLIVMALRQKYSFIDRMMGTVTAHTIEKSAIPVLAIPNGAQYEPINNILFPTEMHSNGQLNEQEEDALEWLAGFWELCEQPEVDMVHINTDKGIDIEYKNRPLPNMNFLESYAKSVDEGILNIIDKKPVNLLAFYKPNRSFWERLYHSSVTRKLLFQSRLPVLIFH